MLPEERRRRILRALDGLPLVRMTDLAGELGVSLETVRRDVVALDREGVVRRVYGGITRVQPDAHEPPYERRRNLNLSAKRAMARLAASLLDSGSTLVMDVGTSVLEVAAALPPDFAGRVLTNSLFVAQELASRPAVSVMVSGGELRAEDLALSGPVTEAFFGSFYADRAILGSGGIDLAAGLTDYYPNEIAVRQAILRHAAEAYVLADSSKLGRIALQRVCALTEVTAVITDDGADPELVAELTQQGVRVLVAEVGDQAGDDAGGGTPSLAAAAASSARRDRSA
jgi:DeoR/GlpR family transcriptional regulator of sugar metabolism